MMQISDVAMIRRAQQHFANHQYADAIPFCLDLLRRNPKHYQALMLMLDIAWDRHEQAKAFEFAQRLVKSYPLDGLAHTKLADLYSRTGRSGEAIRLLERFLKKSPGNADAINGLARSYEFAGELDKALGVLEPFIAARTESPSMAYRYCSLLLEQKRYQDVIDIGCRHFGSPAMTPDLVEAQYFLMGRAFESLKDYDKAFEAYAAANTVFPYQENYQQAVEEYDRLIESFSERWLKIMPRARNDSRLPVFIICRPRSGSTLVERIIAAHPKVHAGGESEILTNVADRMNLAIGSTSTFPECVHDLDQEDVDRLAAEFLTTLQATAPKALRITNKNMNTWKELGLLALLCPKAVVIDLRREAVDNCLGIYTAQLFNARTYTRDLRQIGLRHRQYERVMDHWHRVLNIPILRVNYEDIVADQESWTRKIIDFCGLEWDDRCLRFYEKDAQHSTSAAPTLSVQQVRQPIYKSSVSRAKKFEKHLGPLYEALGLAYPPPEIPPSA